MTDDIRIPLTRERILRAAVDLADADGIDGLSMRKLAHSLGYEVMSLYNHVDNKDDLLAGMVDLVAGQIDRPAQGAPWKKAVRLLSLSAHDILLRHRWAVPLWSELMPGPNRIRLMDDILGIFRDGGFSVRLTHFGYHAVTMHVVGFTLQQLSYATPAGGMEEAGRAFLASLDAERFPHLVEHVEFHLTDDDGGDFEFILDLILDGLERSRG